MAGLGVLRLFIESLCGEFVDVNLVNVQRVTVRHNDLISVIQVAGRVVGFSGDFHNLHRLIVDDTMLKQDKAVDTTPISTTMTENYQVP
jgi:hypothetical protein